MGLDAPATGAERNAHREAIGDGVHGAAQRLGLVALARRAPAGQVAQRLVAVLKLLDHEAQVLAVARYSYTDENPAAHGNITVIEECEQCGAQRTVNINQSFHEYGTWGPSRSMREEQQRQEELKQKEIAHQGKLTEGRKIAAELNAYIAGIDPDNRISLFINGKSCQVYRDEIQIAAEQLDNGDGLVPFYMALMDAIDRYPFKTYPGEARFFAVDVPHLCGD